jgi:hypothetical protein
MARFCRDTQKAAFDQACRVEIPKPSVAILGLIVSRPKSVIAKVAKA